MKHKLTVKNILFAIIIFATGVGIFYNPVTATMAPGMTPGEVVATAFAASKGELSELQVEGWAKVNNEYLTMDELRDLGQLVASSLEEAMGEQLIMDPLEWEQATGEALGQRQIELKASKGHLNYSILLQSFIVATRSDNTGLGETYLMVTANTDASSSGNGAAQAVQLEYHVSQAFAPFQESPRMAVLFIGHTNKAIGTQEKEDLVEQMLAAVQGKRTEGISEEFLVSYSGYTDLIPTGWWTGVEEINLQLAVRDHSHNDSSLIYVGYPLILTGY